MTLEARHCRLVLADTVIDRKYGLELGEMAAVAAVAVSVVSVPNRPVRPSWG